MNLKLRWTFAECQACDGIIPRDSLFIDQHGNMTFETPGIDIVIIKNIWSGVCLLPRKK